MPRYFVELFLDDDRENADQVFDYLEGLLWSALPGSELLLVKHA